MGRFNNGRKLRMSEPIIPFSIVVPLYNKEATIARALRSIFNQTVQDFEIIVVNDGSTDHGAGAVEAIGDPRIRLIHQVNQGVSAARNRGIMEAKHDLIAFLDADDEWLPKFLETIRQMVIRYPDCGLYATRYFLSSPEGKQTPAIVRGLPNSFEGVLENYFLIAARSYPPVWTSATCARKGVLMQSGGFPVGVTLGEDLLTWASIAVKSTIAFSSRFCSVYYISNSEIYEWPPNRIPADDDVVACGLEALLNAITPGKCSSLRSYCALWHKMRASLYLRLGMRSKAHDEICQSLNYHFRVILLVYWVISFFPTTVILSIFRIFSVRYLLQGIKNYCKKINCF
jgi:glycosyltransferase involved in cell wall biosynthesis